MNINNIVPVILCGGYGTRLWPLSRESYPKQFLSLNSEEPKSLLQKTQERISGLRNVSSPILVCNEEHRFIVAEQMREINTKPLSILLEPFGRNTAPAIGLAALKALEKEKDPVILVLSSDHEIKNINNFLNVLNEGLKFALKDRLVTFGIIPNSPETGYGYIKSEKPFKSELIEGNKIKEFFEKPDYETAKKFIEDKRFTWNSGIFMFKAKTIISELKKFAPELIDFCKQAIIKSEHDLDFQRLNLEAYKGCPNISIDVAVMEKTNIGTVLPLDAEWSDIGSWEAVWKMSKKDNDGNFKEGKILLEDTKNCYLKGDNRVVVGIGLRDLIVVETNDAILISDN